MKLLKRRKCKRCRRKWEKDGSKRNEATDIKKIRIRKKEAFWLDENWFHPIKSWHVVGSLVGHSNEKWKRNGQRVPFLYIKKGSVCHLIGIYTYLKNNYLIKNI